MTKLIGFGRCLGKTTMAILESHATGNRILVANHRMAENTFGMAQELGYTIPYPICVNDLVRTPHAYSREEHLIIDNVEMVLQEMLYNPVDTITFDNRSVDPEDRYAEEIAELKKELVACYREKEEDQAAIEVLKDKCVDLMLENADYVWDEMARSAMTKRANKRRWRARGCI
ncbi:hypothetical protein [Streptococcus anginosus]|uniref:hypothetical protein n=1 Tax=Streptococcus anginosus TaxID=1328 RepID=UPI0007108903|nr:hypothetical protein [Streptococcus anginosus]